MLGREAYHNPYLLAQVDSSLFGSNAPVISRAQALRNMRPYIERHLAEGGAMHHVTRHVLGTGQGFPARGASVSCFRWTFTRPTSRWRCFRSGDGIAFEGH